MAGTFSTPEVAFRPQYQKCVGTSMRRQQLPSWSAINPNTKRRLGTKVGCCREAVKSSACILRLQITRRGCTFFVGAPNPNICLLLSSAIFPDRLGPCFLARRFGACIQKIWFHPIIPFVEYERQADCARHYATLAACPFRAALPFPHACHGTPEVCTSPLRKEESGTPCDVIDHQSTNER